MFRPSRSAQDRVETNKVFHFFQHNIISYKYPFKETLYVAEANNLGLIDVSIQTT